MYWRIILSAVSIFVLAAGFLVRWHPDFFVTFPCTEPITYKIGTFDQRFNISQSDFLSALQEAEATWEQPISKELFVHNPTDSELLINLIYDYRQEVTSTLSDIENTVDKDKVNYKLLQERYTIVKNEYDELKNIYETRAAAFEERNESYDKIVESWNQSSRTDKQEYKKLEEMRAILEKEIFELKNLESVLNAKAKEVNTLVEKLNHLAQTLNLNVKAYNTVGSSRGETFTGGLYQSDETGHSIDIYEFSSRAKLVRVLMHELGHALGLEHSSSTDAVMYYLNESDAKKLAISDLVALRSLCGIE